MINIADENFKTLVNHILENGCEKVDRTGVGTKSVFGYQQRFNLLEGFPLLTLRKIHVKSMIHEILWFLKSYDSSYDRFGNTNIRYLLENGVTFWTDWCLKHYNNSVGEDEKMNQKDFEKMIVDDDRFALMWGDLGRVYGYQFNNFNGYFNQIENAMELLRNDCDSRRIIVDAWNPCDINFMKLPPCHLLFQFYTMDISNEMRIKYQISDKYKKFISLQLYMRSNDIYLGNPYNVAGYSILLNMFANVLGYLPYEFILTIGDAHLYNNSIEAAKEICNRDSFKSPTLEIKDVKKSIRDFRYSDFIIKDYIAGKNIKVDVAV